LDKRGLTVQPDELTASIGASVTGVTTNIGVAVLSPDEALLEVLEEVVTTGRTIKLCGTESELGESVLSGRIGVALIDAAAIPSGLVAAVGRLRQQFPDLVLVVAGGAEQQGQLAAQIASGQVYRFLHKPVSAQRVRQFIDAALRRHDEEMALTRQATAPTSAPRRSRDAGTDARRLPIAAIGALVALVVVAGAWLALRKPDAPTNSGTAASTGGATAGSTATLDAAALALLDKADKALARGELVAPAGSSAAELYRQVLKRFPREPRAIAGFDKTITELLTAAEQAILANRLDDAGRLIDAARSLHPDNVRIAFLATELGRERERALLTRARTAAATGDVSQALAVLDNKSGAPIADTGLVSEARRALEQRQVDERLRGLLRLAAERMQRGSYTEPASDNSRFYIESARALAPRDPGVERASDALIARVLADARVAVSRADGATGNRLLRSAAELGVPAADVEALRTQLTAALANGRSTELSRLASLVSQRIAQNRLVEPAGDSAKSLFASVVELDATSSVTQGLRQALGHAYLDETRAAIARNDAVGAQRWLSEAEAINASTSDVAAAAAELADLRNRQRLLAQVVGAGTLKRTRSTEPEYPRAARDARIAGWVDLEFTVQTDGGVADVKVLAAQPAGTFDSAAVDAVTRWRYQPVKRDGVAVPQRARLRMRFALE
jgi:TonB family protein